MLSPKFPRVQSTNRTIPVTLAAFMLLAFIASPSSRGEATTSLPEPKTRVLTMAEAIQMALSNNLDIRISQITPQIDQLTMNALYGVYDPAFSFSAIRSINTSPGGGSLANTAIPIPPTTAKIEAY